MLQSFLLIFYLHILVSFVNNTLTHLSAQEIFLITYSQYKNLVLPVCWLSFQCQHNPSAAGRVQGSQREMGLDPSPASPLFCRGWRGGGSLAKERMWGEEHPSSWLSAWEIVLGSFPMARKGPWNGLTPHKHSAGLDYGRWPHPGKHLASCEGNGEADLGSPPLLTSPFGLSL